MDKIVLADGKLFFFQAIDEKAALKNPIRLEKDTFQNTRRWYEMFCDHMQQHGIYIHPLYLFRANHGGEWGFSIGDDADDDLPKRMSVIVHRCKGLVFQILSQKDMFPANSNLKFLVANSNGDGYYALKAILRTCHPAFQEAPATLTAT